jgi:hypothetical protein
MEMTTADHLRAVVAAWDSWFEDDGASSWERRCRESIDAARAHLSPTLVEDDPPTPVRSVP